MTEATEATPAAGEQQCDFEEMSRTTEHHERLKPFEGTFKGEVKMWMGPGDPMVSTGTMVNSLELGGKFLHQLAVSCLFLIRQGNTGKPEIAQGLLDEHAHGRRRVRGHCITDLLISLLKLLVL